MKKLFFATVAAAAISLPVAAISVPAFAQQQNGMSKQGTMEKNGTSSQPKNEAQSKDQSQYKNQSQKGESSNEAANEPSGQAISPDSLKQSQVKQIQQALDKKGYKSGKADGKWGPDTEAALKKFQQSQNFSSPGKLDEQTVSALGLDASEFGMSSQTTGQGSQMKGNEGNESNEQMNPTQPKEPSDQGSQMNKEENQQSK